MAGDLLWDSVVLALHMDDIGLTDVKGNAMTLNGGVTRSATESVFGGYSAYFDGVDSEITNTSPIAALDNPVFSVQLWCWPDTQVSADPVVFSYKGLMVEYKPTGFSDGFVINANGTRTACGAFAESAWHYGWIVCDGTDATVYINGVFIATVAFVPVSAEYVWLGGNDIGANPESAFKGYIDDALVTPSVERTDYSVPVTAFPDTLPDPTGDVVGGLGFSGASVGIVAPIGDVTGGLRFVGAVIGEVPNSGRAVGSLRFTGAAAGVVGRTVAVVGSFGFSGTIVGGVGKVGSIVGALRFAGAVAGSHGVSGAVAGTLGFVGSAIGTTPIVPFGQVAGVLRFAGHAIGLGAPVEEDACA